MGVRNVAWGLGVVIALAITGGGCGRDDDGPEQARRADSRAQADARILAETVEACRAQHPGYLQCDEPDELAVFVEACSRGSRAGRSRCGDPSGFQGLAFGDTPGQVLVLRPSRAGYTVRAFSSSGATFSIVGGARRAPRRVCTPGSGTQGACRDGSW